jgi:hypothetical protein
VIVNSGLGCRCQIRTVPLEWDGRAGLLQSLLPVSWDSCGPFHVWPEMGPVCGVPVVGVGLKYCVAQHVGESAILMDE